MKTLFLIGAIICIGSSAYSQIAYGFHVGVLLGIGNGIVCLAGFAVERIRT